MVQPDSHGDENANVSWHFIRYSGVRCMSRFGFLVLHLFRLLQLAVQFLAASASPQNCWTLIGIGLRVAQDVGAHRKTPRSRPAAQDELWKRGFWYAHLLPEI